MINKKVFIGIFFLGISCKTFAIEYLEINMRKQAKEIIEIYKKTIDGKLDSGDSRKLQKISSTSIFSEFMPLSLEITKVQAESASEKLYPVCKDFLGKYNSQKNKVIKLFYYATAGRCFEKFYKGLAKSGDKNKTEKTFDLFKSSPKEFRTFFSQYLSTVDNSSMDFLELAENYIELIKIDNDFVDSEITSILPPSQELSNIIQLTNDTSKDSKNLFQKELKSILDQILVHYDRGDIVDSAKYFDYAVSFYSENLESLDLKKSWLLFTSTAKSLLSRGEENLSKKIMDYSSTLSIEDLKNESIFNQYWSYIVRGDFKSPIELAKKNKIYDEINFLDQKLIFWIGYCHYKLGDTVLSQKYFSRLITNYPLGYYSAVVLSFNIFQPPPIKANRQLASIKETSFNSSIERIKYWAEIGYDKFVNAEIDSIIEGISKQAVSDLDRNYKIEKLSEILFKNNKHYLNFRAIHQTLDDKIVITERMIRYLFPTENMSIIKKNIGQLPLSLPISLMRQESAFNKYAVSIAGAQGLMQLMPNTAKRYKKNVHIKELHNPDINIQIGMQYLKELSKRYDGNLINILAAYNAGEGNVAKWSKNILIFDDPLINIETIPFRETRQYVKLIYRNMFFYSKILNEQPLSGFKIPI